MLESREPQHVVLAEADAAGFASLRQAATPRSERYAIGRGLRRQVPRSSLADWDRTDRRADPVQQVIAGNEGRVERLIPVRIGRIAQPVRLPPRRRRGHGRGLLRGCPPPASPR